MEFFRRDSTQELVRELESQTTQVCVNKKRGRYGGTFVAKELVYAYAMWISPAFQLKVIRAPHGKASGWQVMTCQCMCLCGSHMAILTLGRATLLLRSTKLSESHTAPAQFPLTLGGEVFLWGQSKKARHTEITFEPRHNRSLVAFGRPLVTVPLIGMHEKGDQPDTVRSSCLSVSRLGLASRREHREQRRALTP
ncbi:KilA-N domain-containing protein [Halomonas kalidii]|uniref:KilA-N domain-containing protein n=1 Tax=Halomonas kalidii TaxID=3043293 RepID=UPI0038991C3E